MRLTFPSLLQHAQTLHGLTDLILKKEPQEMGIVLFLFCSFYTKPLLLKYWDSGLINALLSFHSILLFFLLHYDCYLPVGSSTLFHKHRDFFQQDISFYGLTWAPNKLFNIQHILNNNREYI